MNDRYDLTLQKLGNLSLEVRIEKFSRFDLLTGVRVSREFVPPERGETLTEFALWHQTSWKTALDTIEARLGLQLDPGNGSLGHWKTIIGKAYADFRENLPEFEPDLFVSLVFATDGRSEGSDFPNLLVATERERFGI
jgi:hypothetical protein